MLRMNRRKGRAPRSSALILGGRAWEIRSRFAQFVRRAPLGVARGKEALRFHTREIRQLEAALRKPVPDVSAWRMPANSPRIFAGHSMLCPYGRKAKPPARRRRYEKQRGRSWVADGRRYLAVALFFAGLVTSCERSGAGCTLAPRATGYFIAIHFSSPPSMIFTLK